jgi:hypothetical protein
VGAVNIKTNWDITYLELIENMYEQQLNIVIIGINR